MTEKETVNNGAYDNSLSIIYDWLKKRLGTYPPNVKRSSEDSSKLRDKFIEQTIERIAGELGVIPQNRLLVTVRRSFRKSQKYLRPVYSYPNEELRKYLEDPKNQAPFSFPGPVSNVFAGLTKVYPEEILTNSNVFGALHKISINGSDSSPTIDKSIDPQKAFAPRIDNFWNELRSKDDFPKLRDLANNDKPTYCFFSGRNKSQNYGENQSVELDHIIAI